MADREGQVVDDDARVFRALAEHGRIGRGRSSADAGDEGAHEGADHVVAASKNETPATR